LSARYFIRISFKGTNYKGWQVQSGSESVQGSLSHAVSTILREPVSLTGAGRTDTGVHAINYYAHFNSSVDDLHLSGNFIHSLNAVLPYDIFVHDILRVSDSAHARYDAIRRTYHYLITRNKNPFLKDLSWHIHWELDLEQMNKACTMLKKYDDFTSFSKLHSNNRTNFCLISEAEWREVSAGIYVFRISANRFLRGMVRAIVGTMTDIGRGKIPFEDIGRILQGKNRCEAGMAARPEGLFLTDIFYREGILQDQLVKKELPLMPASSLFF